MYNYLHSCLQNILIMSFNMNKYIHKIYYSITMQTKPDLIDRNT